MAWCPIRSTSKRGTDFDFETIKGGGVDRGAIRILNFKLIRLMELKVIRWTRNKQQLQRDETGRDLQSVLNKKHFTRSFADQLLQSITDEQLYGVSRRRNISSIVTSYGERYSVSRTSKRGADFEFEFQTDPVGELVEVRTGVDAQVEVRGQYSSKGPASPYRRKLTQEQRASRGVNFDFDFEFETDPVDELVDVWKGQACREE